jgi:hypothetical protein
MKNLTAMILLAAVPLAEVEDGSKWTGGGGSETVTVNVEQHSTMGTVGVTFSDSDGAAPEVTGTPGANSSSSAPTCEESPEASPPGANNGYRCNKGKVQRKNDRGEWVNMRKKKDPTKMPGGGNLPSAFPYSPVPWGIGNTVTSLPFPPSVPPGP